jgi:hypothetical protein
VEEEEVGFGQPSKVFLSSFVWLLGRKESARRRLLTDTPVAEVVVAALLAVSVLGKLADSALIAPCRRCDRALSLSRIVQPLEKIRNLEKSFESKAHPKSHLLDLDR